MRILFTGSLYDCRAFCHKAGAVYDMDAVVYPIKDTDRFRVLEVEPATEDRHYAEYRIEPVK